MAVAGASASGGGAGNVRAGGAYFEFFAVDKLTGVLDKMKSKAMAFGSFLKSAAGVIAGAAASVGISLSGIFLGGVSTHADMARLADRFQLPIRLMSKLKHVADEAGVSIEDVMNDTTGRYSARIAAAPAMSDNEARQALELEKEWARAIRELQAALMPIVPLITDVVSAFASVAVGLKNLVQIARDLVGSSGAERTGFKKLLATFTGLGSLGHLADKYLNNGGKIAAGTPGVGVPSAKLAQLAMAQAPTQVRGAFQTFGAMGQFGFGDGTSEVQKQTELMRQLLAGEGALPDKIGAALGGVLGMK